MDKVENRETAGLFAFQDELIQDKKRHIGNAHPEHRFAKERCIESAHRNLD
jgi:hypothetical protein